jgi:hypothetical protein
MKKLNRLLVSVLVVGLVLTAAHVISAQQRGGMQRPGRQPGQGRQFDPEQMISRRMENIMQELSLPDEEASVLKPRIEKLLRTRMDQSREMGQLIEALQQAIDAKDDGQVKAKLAEVKAKRKEQKAQVDAMEEELLGLLSLKAEALLTVQGIVNGDGFGMRFGGPRGQGRQGAPGGQRMQRRPGR